MLEVFQTAQFKKDLRRARRRGWDMSLLAGAVDLLRRRQPLPARYRDHALAGDQRGFRDLHVKPDWVLVYQVIEDELVLILLETGSHADLSLD